MKNGFNLAARPFVNRRPWRRLTALLWALGITLLAFNAVLYWGYLTGSADARSELAGLRQQLADDGAELDRLGSELARLDVQSQNREVAFLNERIADRRFPWGRLFADIEQVLPWNTRLRSLAPQPNERRRRQQVEPVAAAEARVMLDISGEAQDDEGLLELIDSLFEHPSFDGPKLRHESQQDSGPLDFTIAVAYRPGLAAGEPESAADETAADETESAADETEAPADETAADETEVAAGKPGSAAGETESAAGKAEAAAGETESAADETESAADAEAAGPEEGQP